MSRNTSLEHNPIGIMSVVRYLVLNSINIHAFSVAQVTIHSSLFESSPNQEAHVSHPHDADAEVLGPQGYVPAPQTRKAWSHPLTIISEGTVKEYRYAKGSVDHAG